VGWAADTLPLAAVVSARVKGDVADMTADTACPVHDFLPGREVPALGNAQQLDVLREEAPIFRSTASPQGFWALTRADDIRAALQDPATFSSSSTVPTDPNPPYLWIPQMLDPPRHTAWRHLLGPYFSPGNMRRLEESVHRRCLDLLDGLAERGGCDFLGEFAQRFPTSIFLDMFGLPIADLGQFLTWEHEILHLTPEEDPDRTRSIGAMFEVMAYFDELITARRADPKDDILSDSLSWTIEGEAISHQELLSFCLLMFMAGLDTVTIQLGYSFWHLATHPEDRQRIVADPGLIPAAVEELLRVYAFVPPGRKVMQDVELHGSQLHAGDMVYMHVGSACRDPRLFPDRPAEAVIDRSPNPHFAFGAGPHRCLGAALARRELRVALEEWHARIPDYRMPEGFEVTEIGGMHGIRALSLVWS
jgi:cytochrome P450